MLIELSEKSISQICEMIKEVINQSDVEQIELTWQKMGEKSCNVGHTREDIVRPFIKITKNLYD